MLDKIEVSHPHVEVAKAHVHQNFRQDISGALAYLSIEFADMFTDAMAYRCGRARISTATGDCSVHPKMEDGPTCRPDSTFIFYGIDVMNPHCTFTSQENVRPWTTGTRLHFSGTSENSQLGGRQRMWSGSW